MNPITKLLKKAKPATQEVREAIAVLQARQKEIEARALEIMPASGFSSAGPERIRVQLEGEPADLVVLDRELELLKAELSAMPAKHDALRKRLEQAEADEAARSLPAQVKALPDELKRLQAAQAAADHARAELQEALTAIGQARRAIEGQGGKAPAVDYPTAAAIADALGLQQPEAPTHYSRARAELFQRLGAEQREIAEAEQAAQRMGKRDGFAAEANDGNRPGTSYWGAARNAI